mmetsp:Transcript_27685/g.64919  ORF Transcript_27685/g.64919 Transcript_27685/m.64919 type:complete len:214 (+) Transcript_27685:78-719(+)
MTVAPAPLTPSNMTAVAPAQVERYQTYTEAVWELDEARRIFAPKPRPTSLPAPPMPPRLRPAGTTSPTRQLLSDGTPHAGTWPGPSNGMETNGGQTTGNLYHPYSHVGFASGFGTQIVGGRSTSPSFAFGPPTPEALEKLRARVLTRNPLADGNLNMPAPGSYEATNSFGKQISSFKPTAARYSFTHTARFDARDKAEELLVSQNPGPGTYRA